MKTKQIPVASRWRADGSCSLCAGGWLCKPCQADNAENDRKRLETLTRVCRNARAEEIARVCARFEFESDEFQTREQKAERYLASGQMSARF